MVLKEKYLASDRLCWWCSKMVIYANGWNINIRRKKAWHIKFQIARRKDTLFHTFSCVVSIMNFWEASILLLLGYEKLLSLLTKKNSLLMQMFCQQNCISVTYLWKHRKIRKCMCKDKEKTNFSYSIAIKLICYYTVESNYLPSRFSIAQYKTFGLPVQNFSVLNFYLVQF